MCNHLPCRFLQVVGHDDVATTSIQSAASTNLHRGRSGVSFSSEIGWKYTQLVIT